MIRLRFGKCLGSRYGLVVLLFCVAITVPYYGLLLRVFPLNRSGGVDRHVGPEETTSELSPLVLLQD